MPKDRVEAAIKRALGKDTSNYEEIVYEGYAPHGVAVLVEAATVNPTRTVANVRMHFTKNDGSLGTSGSVAFAFRHLGEFKFKKGASVDMDELELELIDHGLEEIGEDADGNIVVRTSFNDFGTMARALEEKRSTCKLQSLRACPSPRLSWERSRRTKYLSCRQAGTGRRRAEGLPQLEVIRATRSGLS